MATAPKTTNTASKPAAAKTAARSAAAKPKAETAVAGAESSVDGAAVGSGVEKAPTLRIRDLLLRVAEVSGAKKNVVRPIVEATLTVLGEALARGDDMNLPGLGKTRIARSAERDGTSHMTLKVKRGPHKPKAAKEALADEDDDS